MIAGLLLVVLILTVRFTHHRSARLGYLLMLVSLIWIAVDKPMEGRIVVTVTESHGLTAADLAGLVGLALGLHQAWPDVVRRLGRLRR